MRIGRRSVLKSLFGGGASFSVALNASPELDKKPTYRVVELKSGYFAVNGWVLSKNELDELRGADHD